MKNTAGTDAMDKKEEVQQSNDKHISQDFKDYPKGPGKDDTIHPKTKADKLTAQTQKAGNGAKRNPPKKKSEKPGEPNKVEKKLADNLGGAGEASDTQEERC